MVLLKNVAFKFVRNISTIVLFSIDESLPYFIYIKTENYCADLFKLFNNDITHDHFKSSLAEAHIAGYENLLKELAIIGVVKSVPGNGPLEPIRKTIEVKLGCDGFYLHVLPINQLFKVHSYSNFSEGEPCAPLGDTACNTTSGTYGVPNELWECISGSPNNWSAMGVSC